MLTYLVIDEWRNNRISGSFPTEEKAAAFISDLDDCIAGRYSIDTEE